MKTESWQQCIIPSCRKKYSIEERRTTCDCGELLDVRYKGDFPRSLQEKFSERRNSRQNVFDESGVWRFRELLNFAGVDTDNHSDYSQKLVSLDGAEGRTKPFHLVKVADYAGVKPESFWLQFEGDNPTGSFKDNGMATAFTHAKIVGAKKVICASTGNTSSSAAAFAAHELDMEAVILVGEGKIAKGKLAQSLAYGAKVLEVKGDFDVAMAMVKALSMKSGVYVVNSLNAFRLEGQKTMMYRVLDYLGWEVPDWIVFPGGNLGNTSAFGKAFMELYDYGWIRKKPRMAVVVAEGAHTLADLYNDLKLRWNGGNIDNSIIDDYYAEVDRKGIKANTRASAIEILKPVNLKKALRTLEFADGVVTKVSDEVILDAMAMVSKNGFGCEPASAATVAGTKKLVEQGTIGADETVVGISTGHMLKDVYAIVDYHFNPKNRFANAPITVEPNIKEILKLVDD
ncbi:MAG TPA: threonine synthase [Candidatus Bathyarchaeota archaeon]|nr:threonine synthase [Candidatus Bathyarchaeota archaeon]